MVWWIPRSGRASFSLAARQRLYTSSLNSVGHNRLIAGKPPKKLALLGPGRLITAIFFFFFSPQGVGYVNKSFGVVYGRGEPLPSPRSGNSASLPAGSAQKRAGFCPPHVHARPSVHRG